MSGPAAALGRYWPEAVWNPCRAQLPRHLAEHELVAAAWKGIDPAQLWDSHAHLVGTGDSGSGIWVHPSTDSLLSPGNYARRLFILNAGCAHEAKGSVDRSYVERMLNLMDGMRAGAKMLLFAFDRTHDAQGRPDLERTTLYVPDAYARDVARAHPQVFEWVASIHPYAPDLERTTFHVPDAYARDVARAHPQVFEWVASIHPHAPDALERLARAKAEGARAVKWLPAAMGIDPASPRCSAFYDLLAKTDMPLISHAGLERAVPGAGAQDFGNPLRLRRALDAGVRVVVAHCASMGEDRDLDRGESGPYVESFALFARLMDEKRHEGRLFGDISAMTQVNRAGPALARVVADEGWHGRLLNGSDYPLPGVMPIFSVDFLVSLGLLEAGQAAPLKEIREHNPLLFDFVAKRALRAGGRALPPRVFETRRFFVR